MLLSRQIQWCLEQVHRRLWAMIEIGNGERLPITVEKLDWAWVLLGWELLWFLFVLTYDGNVDRWYVRRLIILFWIVRAKRLGVLNSATLTVFYDSIWAWFPFFIARTPGFSEHLLHLCFKVLSTKLCSRFWFKFWSLGEQKGWLILGHLFAQWWFYFSSLLVEVLQNSLWPIERSHRAQGYSWRFRRVQLGIGCSHLVIVKHSTFDIGESG